jgi:hypothetical protein
MENPMVKEKLIAAKCAYIEPLGCDSTVQYKIISGRSTRRGGHVYGSVQLSDCGRKIDWYFGGKEKESLEKVDKALEMLQEFRSLLEHAYKTKPKVKPQTKVRKRATTST